MRLTLPAASLGLILLSAAATAGAGEIDLASPSLVTSQEIRGAVAVDLANDETTVVVALDEGADGATDYLFTADLVGTLEQPLYHRFDDARVVYSFREGRVQVFAPEAGVNLLLCPERAQPLGPPEPELAATAILWLETKSLGFYHSEGEDRRTLEQTIARQRHAKAEARATRERLRRERPPIVDGIVRNRTPETGRRESFAGPCPEGEGTGGVDCEAGGCGTDVCGIGGCSPPDTSCTEVCTGADEFCCGGCYTITNEAHCECLDAETYCSNGECSSGEL